MWSAFLYIDHRGELELLPSVHRCGGAPVVTGLGMPGKLWSTLILVATIENHILNMTKVTSFPRT